MIEQLERAVKDQIFDNNTLQDQLHSTLVREERSLRLMKSQYTNFNHLQTKIQSEIATISVQAESFQNAFIKKKLKKLEKNSKELKDWNNAAKVQVSNNSSESQASNYLLPRQLTKLRKNEIETPTNRKGSEVTFNCEKEGADDEKKPNGDFQALKSNLDSYETPKLVANLSDTNDQLLLRNNQRNITHNIVYDEIFMKIKDITHLGVNCTNCKEQISGIRYVCPKYGDQCFQCWGLKGIGNISIAVIKPIEAKYDQIQDKISSFITKASDRHNSDRTISKIHKDQKSSSGIGNPKTNKKSKSLEVDSKSTHTRNSVYTKILKENQDKSQHKSFGSPIRYKDQLFSSLNITVGERYDKKFHTQFIPYDREELRILNLLEHKFPQTQKAEPTGRFKHCIQLIDNIKKEFPHLDKRLILQLIKDSSAQTIDDTYKEIISKLYKNTNTG